MGPAAHGSLCELQHLEKLAAELKPARVVCANPHCARLQPQETSCIGSRCFCCAGATSYQVDLVAQATSSSKSKFSTAVAIWRMGSRTSASIFN
jgi:hypothetical protein